MTTDDTPRMWLTESGVGGLGRRGFVVVGPEGGPKYQMLAESARELGYALIDAANAADRDEDLFRLLVEHHNMPAELVASVLGDLRVMAAERQDGSGPAA